MKVYVSVDKVAICEEYGAGEATRCISVTHDMFVYTILDYLEQMRRLVKEEVKWVFDHAISALEQLLKVVG